MSKGAFTIIDSYVGKQEQYLTASTALHTRLKQLYESNLESGDYVRPEEAMPSFIDISRTHMFFVKRVYKPFVAFAYEYFKSKVEVGNSTKLPIDNSNDIRFNLRSNNGDFINDMVIRIVLDAVGIAGGSTRYKYCDYPGARLIKRIRYIIDKEVLDEYTSDDILFYMNNRLDNNKRSGFERMLGQEQVIEGEYYHHDSNVNQVMYFKNGPQTFKPYQPQLELWIPLIFDFNTDVGRSFHNKVIGGQQVYVEVSISPLHEIIQAADSNNTIIPNGITSLGISDLSLYSKNIYMNPEINDLFSEKYNLSMIRVHRNHTTSLSTDSTSVQFTSFKYPIEIIHFGFRPNANNNFLTNAKYAFTDWHKMGRVICNTVPIPAIINGDSDHAPYKQLVVRTAKFRTCVPPVSYIGFIVHGNRIYSSTPESFYSDYLNWTTPGLATANQCGYYTVSFSHYPTQFNPSGHINNSTSREFYIEYTSTYIGANTPTTLIASAQCVNFLFYSQKSVSLKYIA